MYSVSGGCFLSYWVDGLTHSPPLPQAKQLLLSLRLSSKVG